jgi:peptidylprolyl isomerase
MSKVEDGNVVNVHYVGTFDDGRVFDSSREREKALTFQVGGGQVVPGFSNAVVGMEAGEIKKVKIEPEEAYGYPVEEAIREVPMSSIQGEIKVEEGMTIVGHDEAGQTVIGKVLKLGEEFATIDFNHPLAGNTLNFEIEMISFT